MLGWLRPKDGIARGPRRRGAAHTEGAAMKRFLALFLLTFPMMALPVLGVTASDSRSATAGTKQRVDRSSALVELSGAPVATYEKTRPAKGRKIDFSSNGVKSHRAQLAALRNDFKRVAPAERSAGSGHQRV